MNVRLALYEWGCMYISIWFLLIVTVPWNSVRFKCTLHRLAPWILLYVDDICCHRPSPTAPSNCLNQSSLSSMTTSGILCQSHESNYMRFLPDTQNCGLRMRREYRERFLRHRLQRKPLVSNPGVHHGTCVTHVPWRMSGSLNRSGGENVPGIPGAWATHTSTFLVRGR